MCNSITAIYNEWIIWVVEEKHTYVAAIILINDACSRTDMIT